MSKREPQILYRYKEDYYPSAGLLSALRREVRAAGGEVREWDEGRDMFVGIFGAFGRVDMNRIHKIAYAYSKAKRWFGVNERSRPAGAEPRDPRLRSSFEIESEQALKEFDKRMVVRRSSMRRSCRSPRTGRFVRC
jgi:hypothetical protein